MNTRNSYNRNQYQSARYNSPGTFIPAAQQQYPSQHHNQDQGGWKSESPALPPPSMQSYDQHDDQHDNQHEDMSQADVEMENNDIGDVVEKSGRKKWMKKGVAGFKVSMRERRRRQNRQLRRLITPKNALMVLNELTPGSQHECTVLPEAEAYAGAVAKQYVAVLNVDGIEYRGTGSSKLLAKNNAAEGVIRDMIIKQMGGTLPEATTSPEAEAKMEAEDEKSEGEQSFPMIQLASYALHKLFSDWQTEGFKVPQLTPSKTTTPADNQSTANAPPKAPRKPPVLPPNAEALHPCMLLSQMRGALTYNFLACEGIKPNSQVFSMGVTVDGTTYIGKAPNKKEARKLAAQKACADLFKVIYPEEEEKKVPIEDM